MKTYHGMLIATLAAAMVLCGCPRRSIDLCSGPDMHPECPNAMPGDMFVPDDTDTGDAGDPPDDAADLPTEDMPPDVAPACGGACSDPLPLCDVANDVCVECLATSDCDTGVCTDDNRCVECVETTDCDTGVCNPDDNTCVECVTNAACVSTTASLCDTATNTCTACAASADCAHLTDTSVCDAGECFECLDTDDTTRAACNGNSCDPATNTCTQTPTGSLNTCEYCLADSECPDNYRCVPMEFQGTPRNNGEGGYCLRRVNMMACSDNPYRTVINRTSVGGAPAEDYCGIVEANTTCEAVRALQADTDCTMDEDCGDPNLNDGRCEEINFEQKCTYSCGAARECPESTPCGNNDFFCGGM